MKKNWKQTERQKIKEKVQKAERNVLLSLLGFGKCLFQLILKF